MDKATYQKIKQLSELSDLLQKRINMLIADYTNTQENTLFFLLDQLHKDSFEHMKIKQIIFETNHGLQLILDELVDIQKLTKLLFQQGKKFSQTTS